MLSTKPKSRTDPVRVLTTELTQRVFSLLDVKDLARSSQVCLKWNKSQSLNYGMSPHSPTPFRLTHPSVSSTVWFLQNRKLELGDKTLPTGKWTRKESKENWVCTSIFLLRIHITHIAIYQRKNYMRTARTLSESDYNSTSRYGYSTPSALSSGYSIPRSIREEKWASEAMDVASNKVEMRGMYKELGGRKARGKTKVGMGGGAGARDRGGWDNVMD